MTGEYNPDQPPYDMILFEAQRQERAREFTEAVKSLAQFDMTPFGTNDDEYGLIKRGASYVFPDSQEVDVMYQAELTEPEDSTSAVRVLTPWVEHMGIDGQLRRARLGRYVTLHVAADIDMSEVNDPEDELPESLNMAIMAGLEAEQMEFFERSAHPDYRPPELIGVQRYSIVEVQMERSPNWRTERESTLAELDTKLSHLAARLSAGEEVENGRYTIQEHENLMSLLNSIKTNRKLKPVELSDDIT